MIKTPSPSGIELIGEDHSRFAIPTPALILDIDVLERNIAIAAQQAAEKKIHLRPHCKSHKSVAIAKLQLAAGAVGISCATLGEAEVMAAASIPSLLITSPIVSPSKIARLVVLHQRTADLMVVVDHLQNIRALAEANGSDENPLRVLIDFDIGQKRTGAKSIEEAMTLFMAIKENPSLQLIGLQAYGGHLQHISDYCERQKLIRSHNEIIKRLRDRIQPHLPSPLIITGGGTGTLAIDLQEEVYTELQPGSYIFMDVQYQAVELMENGSHPYSPSLFVITTVISTQPSFAIVDGGLKCFATDGPNPKLFSGASTAASYQFMGDEHGKVTIPELDKPLSIGQLIEFITPHCDPTVNLYDVYHCVKGDTLVDIWPIDGRGLH